MTDAPTSPPAGWYPAPDGSPTSWWWDGAQWSQPQPVQPQPQAAQPQLQPAQQPATTDGLARLGATTQILLIVCGVASIATIATEAFGLTAVTDFLTGDPSAIDRIDLYDQISFVVSILSALPLLATATLWAIWQYRAAKHVAGMTRRGPGWHAGAWFVPIISLWFPYQNVSDLWRAVGRTRPSWLIAWWLLWLFGNAVSQQSTRVYLSAEDLDQFRVAMWTGISAEVLLLAATPFAWLIVRDITRGIRERAAAPVHALAV
jgi:hypothetical protein